MLKRTSKLTAVLAAATTIATVLPAYAADKLETKDGTIDNARAYEGGYVYDGYRTDDDSAALYYNNGNKDVNTDEEEDYDNYDLVRYGEKYATVKDNDDAYIIDLSTGKIDNDETVEDKIEDAKNKLKSKINKEDRYENLKNGEKDLDVVDVIDKNAEIELGKNQFVKVLNDKYGEVWYQFSAAGDKEAEDRTTGAGVGYYQGFTNDGGKYIDVTRDANIYAYDTEAKKTVKIEEYGKNYGKNDLTAKFISTQAIAQDKENLYLYTTVEISGKNQKTTTQYYFQKISKAQGGDEEGGKLPKSTTSYQLNTAVYGNTRIYNDGDAETAADVIKAYIDGDEIDGRKVENIEVNNDAIYATAVKSDNIKMYKLKFKKDKLDTNKIEIDGKTSQKDDVDVYTVLKDSDWDHDTVEITDKAKNKDGKNYSIDKDGNTWILDKGKILKVDGTDFKEVYTCDRSLDKLDVYDENNLIAWCSDGDVYTTASEGKKVAKKEEPKTEEPEPTTSAQVGWNKNADSTWSYYKDGAKVTGWFQDGQPWYYFDAAGVMKTGWQQVGGVWYYLNPKADGHQGVMQTGWVNDNGTWYYCNTSGAMLHDQWFQDGDGKWYYLQSSGAMAVNTTINGYVIGADGAWIR